MYIFKLSKRWVLGLRNHDQSWWKKSHQTHQHFIIISLTLIVTVNFHKKYFITSSCEGSTPHIQPFLFRFCPTKLYYNNFTWEPSTSHKFIALSSNKLLPDLLFPNKVTNASSCLAYCYTKPIASYYKWTALWSIKAKRMTDCWLKPSLIKSIRSSNLNGLNTPQL